MGLPSQIPLPTDLPVPLSSIVPHSMMTLPVPPGIALPPPHGILKKTSAYTTVPPKPKKPPGVPPGPPPELSDDEEEPMVQDGKEYCIITKLRVHGMFHLILYITACSMSFYHTSLISKFDFTPFCSIPYIEQI
jgi:hypothetical protein